MRSNLYNIIELKKTLFCEYGRFVSNGIESDRFGFLYILNSSFFFIEVGDCEIKKVYLLFLIIFTLLFILFKDLTVFFSLSIGSLKYNEYTYMYVLFTYHNCL